MRRFLPVFAVFLMGAGAQCGLSRAEGTCAGSACGVVSISADGCQWTNKGDKAVRLSLSAGGVARVVTVLAAGESYRERDKARCAAKGGDGRYDASFAALAIIANEPLVRPPAPRGKPAAPAAATETAQPISAAPAGSNVPLPRAKPAPPPPYPPLPRAKPAGFAASAEAPSAVATAAAPATLPPVAECGDTCPPILFKVVDDCLWVLNLNPRRVAFEAEAAGKRWALALEAANGAKADARAAHIAAGRAARDEAGLHMRLADPFQSAGSGIPIYRARLGAKGACVKSRDQITRFTANYVK